MNKHVTEPIISIGVYGPQGELLQTYTFVGEDELARLKTPALMHVLYLREHGGHGHINWRVRHVEVDVVF